MTTIEAVQRYLVMFFPWGFVSLIIATLMHSIGPIFDYVFDAEQEQHLSGWDEDILAITMMLMAKGLLLVLG